MTTEPQPIRIDAGGWGMTWAADAEGELHQIGLGPEGHLATLDADARWYPVAVPTWGGPDPYRPAALRVTHADGTTTTRLILDHVDRREVPGGELVIVALRDELQSLDVELHLRTHTSGVLEQWVEIHHDQDGPVRLHDYDSVAPYLLVDPDAELHQFGGGGWADEWRWTTQPLTPGTTTLASLGGLQPHLQRSPVLLVSPNGPSTETEGDVLGLSIAWGGNTQFALDVRPVPDPGAPAQLRLRAGANPYGADYVLDAGTRFVTPTVAWTWSVAGRRELSSRFHRWTRERVLRDPQRLRPLVVNNWEATFFEFDEPRIVELIDRAAALGADVFLLDDGWFGTTHPRDDDTTSLGDWDPDPAKLPDGLAPLAEAAVARDLRFGIWLEPEMVNPVSDLHDRHPDWVLRDRREPRLHRHQLALDPLLADVRDFEVDVVDRTLAMHPAISYVKWDANRPITDPGSTALAPDRQSNLWVDHVHATWQVMAEVVRRHPDVELMLCASGGGRTDHGSLRWFHEFWTSDNTDPVTRVRMQWGCSQVFPAAAMAAHVTRWGERPLDFACAVALSGRFGIDLDLRALSDDEFEVCRRAVAVARRTQALVQQGALARLVSPVEGPDRSRAALEHVAADGSAAVLFAYQLESSSSPGPIICPAGLDPDAVYRVRSTDLSSDDPAELGDRTGEQLAVDGLDWPLADPCTARIWELERH
ncbi:MAG: alpha-galactosidase [Microthrixaceae bacterium]